MKIKVKYFNKDYPKLEKIHKGDFIDLRVDSVKKVGSVQDACSGHVIVGDTLHYKKGDVIRFGLGVAIELPNGYEAEVRSRSSTFKRTGLILTNSVGTIDNSYCGDADEWQAEFVALRGGHIKRFDRLCQFRIWENQPEFKIEEVEHLGGADRGGFGTTGR